MDRVEEKRECSMAQKLLYFNLNLPFNFSFNSTYVQRTAKVDAPGCVHAAGKLGQE